MLEGKYLPLDGEGERGGGATSGATKPAINWKRQGARGGGLCVASWLAMGWEEAPLLEPRGGISISPPGIRSAGEGRGGHTTWWRRLCKCIVLIHVAGGRKRGGPAAGRGNAGGQREPGASTQCRSGPPIGRSYPRIGRTTSSLLPVLRSISLGASERREVGWDALDNRASYRGTARRPTW